jgi:predicted nucleic acid-binding protein
VIRQRSIVIDASIAISIARGEPSGPAASAAISTWSSSGARVVVPSHFWLEVANALLIRWRWPGEQVLEVIHLLDQMRFDTIDLDRAGLLLAIDISERHRLTVYDATYLALAISMDGSLVTFDAALRAAAGSRALHVGPARLSETPAAYEHDVTWPNYKGASAFLAKLRAEAARPG